MYLLIGELISWFMLFESLKTTCARSYAWFLNFLSNGEGFDCFCDRTPCPNFVRWLRIAQSQQNDFQFWTAQKQQNDKFANLYIFNHGEARNVKIGQQVNLIQRAPLDTPPQEVVMSWPHNHVIVMNLFICSYKGLLLSNLGSRNKSLIEVHRTLLHWG